ncbi:MAG: U32 family peptidase [Oscillospiraceae bacterium]|nr:U32 family peptidase [Oscillospiraceae bacterium]
MADKPELLSPAGDWEKMTMAVAYGADAVYLAGHSFGMRSGAGNFNPDELTRAVAYCHKRGVKVYVTCNTVPHDRELRQLPEYLMLLNEAGADAVIAADIGVMEMVRRYTPRCALHASTQTGIANSETALALRRLGADRVILARELTLEEIREIRENTPAELELEVFVHGAMCVSFSGRCLLSDYLTGRDANRGQCAQPCRWKYHLVEEKRPGQYMEITEDGGTYILNSRDLRMIEHLSEILETGVTGLKIEGRAKSAYYAGAVTGAYRQALDAAMEGRALDPVWVRETELVSHREYSTGFYFDSRGPGQYNGSSMYTSGCDVAAFVEACAEDGQALLSQRNKIAPGDALSLMMPGRQPVFWTAGEMQDEAGAPIDSTPHPMMRYRMKLPVQAPPFSVVRRMKQK